MMAPLRAYKLDRARRAQRRRELQQGVQLALAVGCFLAAILLLVAWAVYQ